MVLSLFLRKGRISIPVASNITGRMREGGGVEEGRGVKVVCPFFWIFFGNVLFFRVRAGGACQHSPLLCLCVELAEI